MQPAPVKFLLSRGWHFFILHVVSTISQILKHIQDGIFFFPLQVILLRQEIYNLSNLPSAPCNATTTTFPSRNRFWWFNSLKFRDPFSGVVPFYFSHPGGNLWNTVLEDSFPIAINQGRTGSRAVMWLWIHPYICWQKIVPRARKCPRKAEFQKTRKSILYFINFQLLGY